jgi:hypothetical protein
MGLQMIAGRAQPVFPRFLMTRRLPTKQPLSVGARGIHVLKYLEKLVHLRWPRTFEVAKRGVSYMILLLTVVLLLTPIPLSNVGVEAVMTYVLHELLLYCCLAAFVTGIVLAAATLIS